MTDIVKRLRIKAGMIQMGERIAWGSDSDLMNEAADVIERMMASEEQYTPGDMADQGAQGWRDGYRHAKGEACPEGHVMLPVEPTIEMIAALGFGGDVQLAIGHAALSDDIERAYKAMLAAAPQAEQTSVVKESMTTQPVAYAAFSDNGNIQIWSADPVQVETLRQQYGHDLKPLYAAPQAEQTATHKDSLSVQPTPPDVAGLVEALELASKTLTMACLEGEVTRRIDAALAAYRKGGEQT